LAAPTSGSSTTDKGERDEERRQGKDRCCARRVPGH
jgi:hypothetical protein